MSYKSTNGLMKHLRSNGIDITGSVQKRQLINSGYFHGYKGYRFFNTANKPIPFATYSDINATIKYDSDLKSLFYGRLMFIETAVKSIALERIMSDSGSENIQEMFRNVVSGYNNLSAGATNVDKKNAQTKKLNLEKNIQVSLLRAYEHGNPKITHYYNKGNASVPLWALFEILTLGDFANLLSCLIINTRRNITQDLGMNVANVDTNYELVYRYLYALKDLRNAVAHNSVVFDTRFREFDPSKAMKKCLEQEFHLPYVNFKSIGDYVILICYYLKLLSVSKTEIKSFIREFEKITNTYINAVDTNVSKAVIHPDLMSKINILKNFI